MTKTVKFLGGVVVLKQDCKSILWVLEEIKVMSLLTYTEGNQVSD